MFLSKILLQTVVAPALVSGILFWLVERTARRLGLTASGSVALAAGYLTGHLLIVGLPSFPPPDTTGWLPILVVLSVLLGLQRSQSAGTRMARCAILVAAILASTLRPMLLYHWEMSEASLWLGGLLFGLFLLWYWMDLLARRAPDSPLLELTFLIVSVAAAATLALSATALLAQLAAVTAASFFVLLLFLRRRSAASPSWLAVGLMVLTGLGVNGYFYAQVSGWQALTLAAALPAAWLNQLKWIRSRPQWLRLSGAAAGVLVAATVAVVGAWIDFAETSAYDDY